MKRCQQRWSPSDLRVKVQFSSENILSCVEKFVTNFSSHSPYRLFLSWGLEKKYAIEFKFNQLSGSQEAFQATWQEHNKRMYLKINGFGWESISTEQSLIPSFILKDIFWFLHNPLFETWALNDMIKKDNVAAGNQMVDYSIQQHKRHSIGVGSSWLCGGIVGDQRQQKYLSPG